MACAPCGPWPASLVAPASVRLRLRGGGASASTGVSATVSAGGSSAALSCFPRRRKLSFGSSSLDSSRSPGFVVSGSSAMPRFCHGPGPPDRLSGRSGAGRNDRAPGQQDADRELVWWVGLTGFEPAASSSRTRRATKLRHSPNASGVYRSRSCGSTTSPRHPQPDRRERQQRRLGAAAEAHRGVRRGAQRRRTRAATTIPGRPGRESAGCRCSPFARPVSRSQLVTSAP